MSTAQKALDVGLIGFGEVGKIFAAGLKARQGIGQVAVWDLKFGDVAHTEAERAAAARIDVVAYESAAALCAGAGLVISAVTASSTLAVAEAAARSIRSGSYFLDLNSASPGTKQRAAAAIEAAGAHYVEAGVMTSVPPYGIKVPMLLGGAKAHELAALLRPFGLDVTPVAEGIGVASATKMSRSIMIKGLEALVIESFTTARRHGVEDAMLATLAETFPGIDWPRQGAYFFSRVAQHGNRRAEEMREAAVTVEEAGFAPIMAAAIAAKHAFIAKQSAAGRFDGLDGSANWQAFADRLIAAAPAPSKPTSISEADSS